MGTLDDAIRQHLELKRRAGAPESEVDRLESEAFGPARREPAAAAAPPPPPPAEEAPTTVADAPAAPPPPAADDSWLPDEPELPAAPSPPEPTGSTATSEYVAPDEEGDDLLEETPDFLQETPEHDRLWFEQKPPKDFDFEN